MATGFQSECRRGAGSRGGRAARGMVAAAGALALWGALGMDAVAQGTPTLLVLRPVTAKAKKGQHSEVIKTPLLQSDVAEIKIGGKVVTITDWQPVLKGSHKLQLMLLLDSMEQIGINEQFDEMRRFFHDLPPNVEIGVGYMLQGKAVIAQTFTTDRELAGKALHTQPDAYLPKNDNGSPYKCLENLAANWPNPDPDTLRAVVMITDGIDRYNSFQGGDMEDPNVQAAGDTMMRAGIMPFPFYYMDPVPPSIRNEGGQLEGQTNFDQLASRNNGQGIFDGQFPPASFYPLLSRIYSILASEAVATVNVNGKGMKQLDVKSSREDIKVVGADEVMIGNVMPKK